MSAPGPVRILMVCLGNICRSPSAEAVLRHRVAAAGLGDRVLIDSAGTHAGHAGQPPDPRSIAHAARRGYDLAGLRARRVASGDFATFDRILAMDRDNLDHLLTVCPSNLQSRVGLLMDYAPAGSPPVVPDPYYGGGNGFERVLDLIELACGGLVEDLLTQGRAVGGPARRNEARYNRVNHSG